MITSYCWTDSSVLNHENEIDETLEKIDPFVVHMQISRLIHTYECCKMHFPNIVVICYVTVATYT